MTNYIFPLHNICQPSLTDALRILPCTPAIRNAVRDPRTSSVVQTSFPLPSVHQNAVQLNQLCYL